MPDAPRVLDITAKDVVPFDVLDEGVVVKVVTWDDHFMWFDIGTPAPIEAVVLDGRSIYDVEWRDIETMCIQHRDPIRVIRGAPLPQPRPQQVEALQSDV